MTDKTYPPLPSPANPARYDGHGGEFSAPEGWSDVQMHAYYDLARDRIAELEAEIAAVGAGGVQALSAVPAEATFASTYSDMALRGAILKGLSRAELRKKALYLMELNSNQARTIGELQDLAASPTPPAEQPKPRYSHLHDADAVHGKQLSVYSKPPGEQQAAPKAAPGEPNTVPAELLEQAYREGWAACRDAETIGEEAEDWAFGNSTANSRMIDAQQAAPQQEAQEPEQGWPTQDQVWAAMQAFSKHDSNSDGMRAALIAGAAPQPAPAPLSSFDACDMATAAAQGFRDGQAAEQKGE